MRSLRVEPGTVARHASDLAGHCQRCPGRFYRENCDGGGFSSESTGVDNTNNGDTENQNSDAIEGGEADPSNGVEQGQPEGKLQAGDGELSDGNAVMLTAEGGQTETASTEIRTADELKNLANASGAASFKLINDIETSGTIQLNNSVSNITLDLNGCKIKHKSPDQPLFNITGGATLTVKDSQQAAATEISANQENKWSNLASMEYGDSNIPTKLTYYVTESVASGTGTNETLKAYEAGIKGAIVACGGNANLKLINLYATNGKGGTFNLESGVITQQQQSSATQQQQSSVSSLVYAENGSSVNMRGGYICGASGSGAGGGIEVRYNSSLSISNGVIAGNSAPSGGGVYAEGSTVKVTGGTISGNRTLENTPGFGGGVMVVGGSIAVSGGFITNNKYANFCNQDGYGDHGGAGLAAKNGTHVTISGGQITGNYSQEAGGGVYVTDVDRNEEPSRSGMAWLNITGGIIASNVSYRSEGAGVRVGQMVDAMINGSSNDSPVYITNNHCMSRFDWGGGGIFVQGNSDQGKEYTAGRLFIYNSYISANKAGGYGGGVAVCPTGKTLVTNTEGTAIFGNSSAGDEHDGDDHPNHPNKEHAYDSIKNTGNDVSPHLSGGGGDKTEDRDAYKSKVFRENGHADFFLAAKAGHTEPLAAVIGKMLGGGDARYSGSKELSEEITIPANGGVQIYQSIGLTSGVQAESNEAKAAREAATTFITGNYSWDHGGGIMSNGDLYLGVPADTYVYPSLKLKATKALINKQTGNGELLTKDQFSFAVYRKDLATATRPSWNDKGFNDGGCTLVGTAKNDANGNIKFDLGEQFLASGTAGNITYYLVEETGGDSGIEYDRTVYELNVQLTDKKNLLMKVPTKDDSSRETELYVHNYTITKVSVTKCNGDQKNSLGEVQPGGDGYYSIGCSDESKTFTNKFTPYDSTGFWTPKATKVVEGGEMKEFTLEFADNVKFEDAKTVKTTADGTNNPQTLSFVDKITYKLNDLNKGEDPTGRGASKTFTYYVREQQPTTPFTNYKYDKSVYKITVTATDQSDKTIKCDATYTKIVNADGKDIPENEQNAVTYVPTKDEATGKEQSVPVFTNTYSTSLPLSGMSGVTLTYLAGAAVLCAAAAWMHIRRKANAKGGKRRE